MYIVQRTQIEKLKPDFYVLQALIMVGEVLLWQHPQKRRSWEQPPKRRWGAEKSKILQKCVTLSFQIIARRFKVFASDLEKAVHYSIAHEVSSPFFCFSSQLDFCTCRLPSIAVLLERLCKHCRSDINCVFSFLISLLSRTMWQYLKSIFPGRWRWCCF